MSKTVQEPCPNCGSAVLLAPSYGGRGTGMLTVFAARCKCGLKEDHFSDNGSKRSAVSGWNKWVQEQVAKGVKKTYVRAALENF